MERITHRTVTFAHPFTLGDDEQVYPAGRYVIETVEELLQNVSFPAYRRTATYMQRVGLMGSAPSELINPQYLDAAMATDRTAR
jgi:hypothetical protein